MNRLRLPALLVLLAFCVFCALASAAQAAQPGAYGPDTRVAVPGAALPGAETAWRLRIKEAAVTQTDMVRLGDIALPLGNMPQAEWRRLSELALWPAPEVAGKPLQINKVRLAAALHESLGDLADSCILPTSLAIQRGGAVLYEEDLRSLVVRTLTPQINLLGGRGELTDFRLPAFAFIAHDGQSLVLESNSVTPGRVGLRFAIKEMDGGVVRRFTGSAFLDLWMDVPSAARPLNKGDAITSDAVSFMSANLAYQKGPVWDGKGGPWQVTRAIGASQPIMAADLAPLAAIHQGDKVTLLYSKGNVQLKLIVEAMADGSPGDTIAVRNMESKKQIFAVVVDGKTVQAK